MWSQFPRPTAETALHLPPHPLTSVLRDHIAKDFPVLGSEDSHTVEKWRSDPYLVLNRGVPDEGLFDVFLGSEKSREKPRIPKRRRGGGGRAWCCRPRQAARAAGKEAVTLGGDGKVPCGDSTPRFGVAEFYEKSHSLALEIEVKTKQTLYCPRESASAKKCLGGKKIHMASLFSFLRVKSKLYFCGTCPLNWCLKFHLGAHSLQFNF